MKNNKIIMALVALIIVGSLTGLYLVNRPKANGGENPPIVVEEDPSKNRGENTTQEPVDPNGTKGEDNLIISEESALQLVSEQLDLNNFTISLAEKGKEIEGNKYYLFDIVNKSGPSFSTQMAVNQRSGDIMAYEPKENALKPMKEFPLQTPIAEVQNWNGTFKPTDKSAATKEVTIKLMQADLNSFEFDIRYKDGDKTMLNAVAQVKGGKATYCSDSGYEIDFVKNGDSLKIFERGISPLKKDEITLEGDYEITK